MSTNSATSFEGPMDPTDLVDYVCEFNDLLEDGETIQAGFTVAATVDAAAAGFEISTTFPPSLVDSDQNVLVWVEVNSANREDEIFCLDGIQAAIEVTITTSSSRRYQRTWLITVKQL